MKKGWMVTLMVVAFMIGTLYGASSGTPTTTPEVTATSILDEQIKHYEQVIARGEEFTSPYSEQVVNGSHKSQLPQQEPEMDNGVIQGTSNDTMQVSGMGHNAVSKFGQEMGNFLMTLVREILRGVVRFFDQLLST